MNAARHEQSVDGRSAGSSSSSTRGARAGAASDPWRDQRARIGLYTLVRVIDVDAGTQEFIALRPKVPDDLADLAFNDRTYIHPIAERLEAEVAKIIADFDARYWTEPTNNQTRFSVLDRERHLFR